jgi:hypothetical protein
VQRRDGVIQVVLQAGRGADVLHQEAASRLQGAIDAVEYALGIDLIVDGVKSGYQIERVRGGVRAKPGQVTLLKADVIQAPLHGLYACVRQGLR